MNGRRPLAIAIVCYPTVGGSGIVATELGIALSERGHTIHFICYNLPARLRKMPPSIHFHPVDVVTYPLFKFPPYTLALASRIARVLQETRIDIVHAHYAIPHTISAQLARDMTGDRGLKIVTTLHGTDVQLVGMDPSYRDIVRYSMQGCCGLTAVSRFLAETTVREFDLDKEIEVIPNFIDPRRFHRLHLASLRRRLAPRGEKILIHLSNFRPVKQVTDVVRVFARMARKMPAVLVMIGDGPDRPAAERMAERLGVRDRTRFLSFVAGVERYLSVADLLLLPSRMESFGLAALEAMACGVPVLAYRVGGLPEVLGDGDGGRLVALGDWMEMARQGRRILDEPALAADLAERGRNRAVSLFSADRIVGRYEDYYYRQLGENSGRPCGAPATGTQRGRSRR